MEKLSVKKPFTVLVAVILVIALGVVSMIKTATDLLPDISLAYLMVIVPYPGASPEKVEAEVTVPMEEALGTVNNVKNVFSVSSENFALLQLEFVNGTNMDSAMVKVSSAINQTAPTLPEGTGTPSIMELSMDMIASMYVAVSVDDMDIYEQSEYIEKEVIPYMQRQNGVASVTPIGLVERYVQIDLSSEKINTLNEKILAKTNEALEEAKKQLDDAQSQVDRGLAELERQQSKFGENMASVMFEQLDGPAAEAAQRIGETAADLADRLEDVGDSLDEADTETGQMLWALWNSLDAAEDMLEGAESSVSSLNNDLKQFDTSTQQNADLLTRTRQLIKNMRTLAGLIDKFSKSRGSSTTLQEISSALRRMEALPRQAKRVIDDLINSDMFGQAEGQMDNAVKALNDLSEWTDEGMPQLLDTLETTMAQITQGQLDAAVGFSAAARQLTDAQTQLGAAYVQYEQAREAALNSANIDSLVDASTLSQLIYAQNFSMPVGYIDDENDNSWLLRVGDEFSSSAGIADALLTDIDGIGTVRISDIADITVLDNAENSFAKLNGKEGIMLCIYKSSTAGTNEVSTNCTQAMKTLMDDDARLHIVKLVDQGTYIDLIINSILKSMLLGALLAVLVLAFFLKDVRPTLIVAVSIPLSVLFALVLMYFTDLSLNMMTLSGLALGIGMLVDNSIVVLENIIRLTNRGIPAARASVQGAKQVAGSIIASTLTTISVFFPIVFTSGTVRELMLPLSLAVSYCLTASLIVAMTVIPASTSTLLKNVRPKPNRLIEKMQKVYGKSLRWSLKHKAVPLVISIALLALSIARIVSMGIVVLPQMTADNIEVIVNTPETDTREESYAKVDAAIEAILGVDGIYDVGAMDGGSMLSAVGSIGGVASGGYGNYIIYLTVPPDIGKNEVIRICDDIAAATEGIDAEITASSGSMTDFAAFVSSGLTINIYGANIERLESIAGEVASAVSEVEGFTEVSTGAEDQSDTLHLVIDKDKAMGYGLTVAQIYMQIASRLNTDVVSTNIDVNDVNMEVRVRNNTDPLTREKLLDMEFEAAGYGSSDQMSQMMGGMGGASAMGGLGGSQMQGMLPDEGEEEEPAPKTHKLSEFAHIEETLSASSIRRENLTRYISVSAQTEEGYNTTLLTRQLQSRLDGISAGLPNGYSVVVAGESDQVNTMVKDMVQLAALGLLFIYLIMVAQFQSLLSPFIILFTVPLAFTGDMLGLIIVGQQMSMLSLMGFLILMGTVVNNGIVFVDYTNQLRIGGLEKWDALVATGQTRMRPILMTAMTTILAMGQLIFGRDMGSQMGRGMAIVIAAGLLYATLMTLFIIPIMYDILYRRRPVNVDVGSDIDEIPDDAAEYLAQRRAEEEKKNEA